MRYHLRMNGDVVGVIDTFELFDGVSLMFNSIPRGTAEWGDVEPRELQIDWCLRGRFELETANGRTIRLSEGEFAFHDERVSKRVMSFPAPLYTGLTLRIDRSAGAASLARALPECDVDLDGIARRLTGESGCAIYTPDPSMRALLESFWGVDERAPLARLRLKALELVTLVATTPHFSPHTESYQRKSAIESLERGMRLLESDFAQDVTLRDAAGAAHMSVSSFKERFAKAFGISPMAYRRQCRLERAAQLRRDHRRGHRADRSFGRVPQPEQVLRRLRCDLFALALRIPRAASKRQARAWANRFAPMSSIRALAPPLDPYPLL